MKQTIEQLIFLAERVREVMTNAPEKEYTVTPMIHCWTKNSVSIYPGNIDLSDYRGIIIDEKYVTIPQNDLDNLQQWADLATDEFNANEGRLRKRNAEWLAAKIKNAEKQLETLKNQTI